MNLCQHSNLVEVRRIENRGRGGRGVFALFDIPRHTLIEHVPVILIPKNQVCGHDKNPHCGARISWYVFGWHGLTSRDYVALALGYGSIYNHSYEPNARTKPVAPDILEFVSLRPVKAGEEIRIDYRGDENDQVAIQFDVH